MFYLILFILFYFMLYYFIFVLCYYCVLFYFHFYFMLRCMILNFLCFYFILLVFVYFMCFVLFCFMCFNVYVFIVLRPDADRAVLLAAGLGCGAAHAQIETNRPHAHRAAAAAAAAATAGDQRVKRTLSWYSAKRWRGAGTTMLANISSSASYHRGNPEATPHLSSVSVPRHEACTTTRTTIRMSRRWCYRRRW